MSKIDLQPHEIQFIRYCILEKRNDYEFLETGNMPIWYNALLDKFPSQIEGNQRSPSQNS